MCFTSSAVGYARLLLSFYGNLGIDIPSSISVALAQHPLDALTAVCIAVAPIGPWVYLTLEFRYRSGRFKIWLFNIYLNTLLGWQGISLLLF